MQQRCAAILNTADVATNAPLAEGASAQSEFATPAPGGLTNNFTSALVDLAFVALSLMKSELSNPSIYTSGNTSTYTLRACNAHGADLEDSATIGDSPPPGVTLAGVWTCSGTGGSDCPGSGGAIGGSSVSINGVVLPGGICVDVLMSVICSAEPANYMLGSRKESSTQRLNKHKKIQRNCICISHIYVLRAIAILRVKIAMMKKRSVCEKEVRALIREWLYEISVDGKCREEFEFADFYLRLSRRYPQCICFKPSACVTHWVRLWFDQEIERLVRK